MTGVVEPRIIRGDARNLPLPDESVDLIVTSPPYFGLRSYQDDGEHYDGQIGAEATPQEFIAALVECTREWVRVLKPRGSLFVNLGDKYSQRPGQYPMGNAGAGAGLVGGARSEKHIAARRARAYTGMQPKSLMLLPERYRIACVDELGLIARAVLVWSKPNGLPESVTDRVRRSHEDWVHLTKSPKYFAAVDEIREPHAGEFLSSGARNPRHGRPGGQMPAEVRGETGKNRTPTGEWEARPNSTSHPLGKLPGSVWEIATQPLRVPAELGVQHFAAFPMEWPRRLILGWSPREVCTACGEGRRPVVEKDRMQTRKGVDAIRGANDGSITSVSGGRGFGQRAETTATITGYACSCPDTSAPSTPGVVLDPFSGTGTTALVASMLGRQGIGVDLSADYCRLAEWRVNDPKQRERASRPAGSKPSKVAPAPAKPVEVEQMPDLFSEDAA